MAIGPRADVERRLQVFEVFVVRTEQRLYPFVRDRDLPSGGS
jgi:hypothetical protein